jgi:prefoldin subunit 5
MNSIQQQQADLDALAREVASKKATISNLEKKLKRFVSIGDEKQALWTQGEIERNQEILKAAENILAEEAGVAAPRARRGRPPLQKR